jgi:hypothetical protein
VTDTCPGPSAHAACAAVHSGERTLTGGRHIIRQQACLTQVATDFRFISTVPGQDLTSATVEEAKNSLQNNGSSHVEAYNVDAARTTTYEVLLYLVVFFAFLLPLAFDIFL